MEISITKDCENCAFYDEDRDNQPCCSCFNASNWEESDNEQRKQIEEIVQDVDKAIRANFAWDVLAGGYVVNKADNIAQELYYADYRKIYDDHQRQCTCYALGCQMAEELKKEVAREIFEEIEERLRRLADESKMLRDKEISLGEKTQLNGEWIGVRLALRDIAELKKKYTGDGK